MKKIVITISLFIITGCSTVPVEKAPEVVKEETTEADLSVKYSEEPNLAPASDRDYRRMTRQRMEDESGLNAGAGSLWVMEGQTSYLFAQNKNRKTGDRTQVKLEGSGLKQLEMKVGAITDLLVELENQKIAAEEEKKKQEEQKRLEEGKKLRLAAIEDEKQKIKSKGEVKEDEEISKLAEERVNKRMPAEEPKKVQKEEVAQKKKEEKPDVKEAEIIPSKIVEKLNDGMYRISGQQTLMIKKRPYKVITTGLVRPEDFSDDVISSNKIYDAQVDVIHIKKTETF